MMRKIFILANTELPNAVIVKKIQSTILDIAVEMVSDKVQTLLIIAITIGCLVIISRYDHYLQSKRKSRADGLEDNKENVTIKQ